MGFQSGFEYVERYKGITLSDYMMLNDYLKWKMTPALNNYYKTFEEFMKYYYDVEIHHYKPSDDVVNFYLKKRQESQNKEMSKTIEVFGSRDVKVDDFITSQLSKVGESVYTGINKKFLKDSVKWIDEHHSACELISVKVNRAFRRMSSSDKEFTYVDGVELIDENGNTNIVRSNRDVIYIPAVDFDEDLSSSIYRFTSAIQTMEMLDKEKYLIWYYRD